MKDREADARFTSGYQRYFLLGMLINGPVLIAGVVFVFRGSLHGIPVSRQQTAGR